MTRRLNIPLAAITAEGFLSRFSFGMINFAVPLYALALGMNLSEIGFLVSLRLGIGLLLTPVAGAAADSIGRKRMLLGGLVVRALIPLLFMLAAVPWHLVAIRMVHGASTAARDPAASSLLADHADEGRLASAFAWQATARHVGGTLGAAFAGALITLSGADYDIVFGAAFVLSVLPLLITAVLVAEANDAPEQAPRDAPSELEASPVPEPLHAGKAEEAPRRPSLLPLALMGTAIAGASHMIHGLFPVLATEYAGLSAAEAGVIYTASSLTMLASGPAFGWLADRAGTGPVLLVRSAANALSSLLYLAAPNLGGMTSGHITDDLGKAAFRPAWGATLATVASHDRRHRTRRLAMMDTGRETGETFAPLLGGFIWDIWGVTALLLARIGLAAAAECYSLAISIRYHLEATERLPFIAPGKETTGHPPPPCAFCHRSSASFETLKHRDPAGQLRRHKRPVCSRCRRALFRAGEQGLVLKATNERWWTTVTRAPVAAPPLVAVSMLNGDAVADGHHEPSVDSAGAGCGPSGEEQSIVVLAADDDPDTIRLIERELTAEGIAVVPARSGSQALLQFGQSRPDIVLLAETIPDFDGLAVMQTLKSTGVPVILLMSSNDAAERVRALELGADDCLVKPFVVPELAARIRAVLRRVNSKWRPARTDAKGVAPA